MFTRERWKVAKECQTRNLDLNELPEIIKNGYLRKIFIKYATDIKNKIKEQNK